MIRDISTRLRNALLPYLESGLITQLGGLVKVKEIKPGKGEDIAKISRKFPIELDEADSDSNEQNMSDPVYKLVPDESKRCIVYFEGGLATPVQNMSFATRWQVRFSLVCWYNAGGFAPTENLQSKLQSAFLAKLKQIQLGRELLTDWDLQTAQSSADSASIFSKYTYSDFRAGYLGSPYGCFQIDLIIKVTNHEHDTNAPAIRPLSGSSV